MKRRLRCLHVLAVGSSLILAIDTMPALADPSSLGIGGGLGPAIAAGEGSAAFKNGQAVSLEVLRREPNRNGWLLRAGYERFDRHPGAISSLQFFNGGNLYMPFAGDGGADDALRMATVELGVRRSVHFGAVRPFVEGLTGVGRMEQVATSPGIYSDRRPDLSTPGNVARTTAFAPAFSLGTGLEVLLPGRLAVTASAGATWAPINDLAGPTFPMRVIAAWPAEPELPIEAATPGRPGPRLRMGAGANTLTAPNRIRNDVHGGGSFAAEIELPFRGGLAWSLVGEQAVQRSEATVLVRQELGPFGNMVNVYEQRPLSLTATAISAGVRVSRPVGAIVSSLRGGLGWGRSGGFGRTISQTSGAYLDNNGQWVPVGSRVDIGGGSPASGFAYSAALAFEARVRGPLGVFAEAGVMGLVLEHDPVAVVPFRLGVVVK